MMDHIKIVGMAIAAGLIFSGTARAQSEYDNMAVSGMSGWSTAGNSREGELINSRGNKRDQG